MKTSEIIAISIAIPVWSAYIIFFIRDVFRVHRSSDKAICRIIDKYCSTEGFTFSYNMQSVTIRTITDYIKSNAVIHDTPIVNSTIRARSLFINDKLILTEYAYGFENSNVKYNPEYDESKLYKIMYAYKKAYKRSLIKKISETSEKHKKSIL